MQCRMLKVATGKLKLEHLVIERGSFKQERESAKVVLQVCYRVNSYIPLIDCLMKVLTGHSIKAEQAGNNSVVEKIYVSPGI